MCVCVYRARYTGFAIGIAIVPENPTYSPNRKAESVIKINRPIRESEVIKS